MLRRLLAGRRHLPHQPPPDWTTTLNRSSFKPYSALALISANDNPSNHPLQVRWKRRDGHSAFFEPRRPTKKQKKEHRRRQRELYHEKVGKHSPPNSKASIRRQHDEEVRQEYLNWNENRNKQPEQLEYDYGDALLDDFMGNTAELTSTPTPEPVYLGHKHEKFYAKVKDQMERYKRLQVKQEDGSLVHITALPSDQDISLLVRSFRDRNGTKLKPVGIVKALEHVLKDVQLPISSFGEKTFNALLTCTASPKEARRIFRLMQENQIPPTSYSWSILVDIHSKTGDFLGCDKVMREMLVEGVKPTLPAYTSLLAACYKVCNSGTIPKSVRAEAGQLGWSKWKEMRILGVDPDVMAYGAMLRLCAARGQAERALNLLEEMQHMEVKPTTLCFTAALKAIARSHQIAIRFENGTSKRYRRRQYVTAHHGKMTREVVLLAERAEVELDDGFIAALMLCAGTAGDSATAKAILLAREVRKLDHLRTIGSNRHLKRLQGINDHEDSSKTIEAKLSQLFLNGNEEAAETLVDNALKELSLIGGSPLDLAHANENESLSFAEREYGKDSRVLSALMHACSQALASSGLGDMWEGRDNKGYLCEISLRMLTVKPEPTYRDNSIPGVDPTMVGLGSLKWDEEEPEHMSKRLRRAKFQGVEIDEESGTNMDDLDPYFYQMFKDDDPALKRGNPDATVEELPADDAAWDLSSRMPQNLRIEEKAENPELPTEEWYFDMDDSRWKTRLVEAKKEGNVRSTHIGLGSQMSPVHKEIMEQDTISAQHDEEWYFDQDESKWKTRSRGPATLVSGERQKIDVMEPQAINGTDLKELSDLFNEESLSNFVTDDVLKSAFSSKTTSAHNVDGLSSTAKRSKTMILDEDDEELMQLAKAMGLDVSLEDEEMKETTGSSLQEWLQAADSDSETSPQSLTEGSRDPYRSNMNAETVSDKEPDYIMEELKSLMPGMPEHRIRKVRKAFKTSLGYPSILTLAPILRENIPERVTDAWLKRKNTQNAYFVIEKAKEDGLMDIHMMNGMLQVECSSGSIDRALACHAIRFTQFGLKPNEYSDRLVLQMLIENHRLSRALQLKEKIEADGRRLDIISYGDLIDYYSKNRQIGSALMTLKECIDVHNAPPNEHSLNVLRRLCRHQGLTDKVGLNELAGPDPLEWLRQGQAEFKREYSKKGRRDVLLPRNRSVDI